MADAAVWNTGKLGLVSCCGAMCLGHESAGVVVQLGSNLAAQAAKASQIGTVNAAGGVRPLTVGTEVTLEPGATCRMCVDCKRGQYQVGPFHVVTNPS